MATLDSVRALSRQSARPARPSCAGPSRGGLVRTLSLAAIAASLVAASGMATTRASAQSMVRMSTMVDMGEDFDSSMMMEAMGGMGGMSGDEDNPASQMKTDLGRAMLRADFSRNPASVLRAQMQLAAKQRDALVKPPESKPDETKPSEIKPAEADDAADAPPAPIETTPDAAAEAATAAPADDTATPAGPADPALSTDPAAAPTPDATATASDEISAPIPTGVAAGATEIADASLDEVGITEVGITEAGADDSGMDPAAAAKMKARVEAMKKVAKQVEDFRTLVIAGDWAGVADWLKREGGDDAGPIYAFMLQSLTQSDSALVPDEIIALSDACPVDLTDKHIEFLGQLLQATQTRGADAGAVAAQIRQGTKHFGGPTDPAKRKRAATLFVSAGLPVEAQAYLPPLEVARDAKDADLLDIYVVYFQALASEKQGAERQALIDQAWTVAQEVLGLDKATADQRAKAVEHAMQILKDVEEDAGNQWLASALGQPSDIGWTIIQAVHQRATTAYNGRQQPDQRLDALTQLRRIGKAIIQSNGAVPYRRGLDMLTLAIVTEAEFTRNGSQQQDEYYGGYYGGNQRNQFQPIPAEQLAEVLPDAPWLASIDPGLSAKLEATVASTLVGSGDLTTALSMIRPIATTDPERAGKLVVALLNAWPNFMGSTPGADASTYNPYAMSYAYGPYSRFGMYGGYGYGNTSSGIPLTRARQIRALAALRTTLDALRQMNLALPPSETAAAFAASHSQAEVYLRQDVEAVFGTLDNIPVEARTTLAQTMRQRLASVWRNPQIQEQAKTKRTNAELVAEVTRGYALARELAAPVSESGPTWEQRCLAADLTYDASEFLFGQNVDMATYLEIRLEAFAQYAAAAEVYEAALAMGKTRPSARIYSQWFNASLGASDVGTLTRQDERDDSEVQRVIIALNNLPPDLRAEHIALFAKEVRTSMGQMAAELKPRYARAAMRVIGDNPAGREIARRLDFYNDLTTEISLGLMVDGGTQVSHKDPFALNLAVWSTRAVSRESGGFAKYLENEQWSPTTGQQVDYRDELEKKIRASLVESFDVVSVTFHKPTVKPMGFGRDGWEAFPLAYILVKAKGPDVDRVPPITIDMDFSDGDGQIILPVSTPLTLIDARAETPAPRAIEDLTIEQTLDDREASTGVVRLTILAKGKGLLPNLDALVDTSAIKGLTVSNIEDGGLVITDLEADGTRVVPLAERTWTLELKPADPSIAPAAFTFPTPTSTHASAKVALKRYTDADIVDATASVPLAALPTSGPAWWLYAVGVGGVVLAGAAIYRATRAKAATASTGPVITIPDHVGPVGAISLLRRIESKHAMNWTPTDRAQLAGTIADIEKTYFAPDANTAPNGNLKTTVEKWAAKAH